MLLALRPARLIALLLPFLLGLLIAPSSARAQSLADGRPRREVAATASGRVVTQRPQGEKAIAGVIVTVHRVSSDRSGPLDSARTDADGRYTVRYPRRDVDDDGVYFAAVVYSGIAYFSAPLRGPRVGGDDGAISVFDTTSGPLDLHVQGHHVVVSLPKADGVREVIEVWEVSNDTTVTLVGRDSLSPVWSAALPSGATGLRGGEGDVAASSIVERGGRVILLSAFGPGVKQLSYSYALPPSRFPLSLSIERHTGVLEVLLEESGARATGSTMRAVAPAVVQGRTFQRFLGQDVEEGSVIRLALPELTNDRRAQVFIALACVMGLAMLAALARAFTRRGAVRRSTSIVPAGGMETLLAEIATLDERHDRRDPSLDEARYVAQRAALKARVAAALAVEGTPS